MRNTKQAIAIGLSEARTAGVEIPDKTTGRKKTSKKKVLAKRSKAASQRLIKVPHSSVSKKALSAKAKRRNKS